MEQGITIHPTIECGKEKMDEIFSLVDSKFEIIKKYAQLIQDETGIAVTLKGFTVLCKQSNE